VSVLASLFGTWNFMSRYGAGLFDTWNFKSRYGVGSFVAETD